MPNNQQPPIDKEILNELKKLNSKLKQNYTFRKRFAMGVINGFGTVIGATVLVSLALLLLKQFATIDFVEPIVDRIIDVVEQRGK